MSELVESVRSLEVPVETSESGTWVRFTCPHGAQRYIVRSQIADGYLTWCQVGDQPQIEWYLDVAEAIQGQRKYTFPTLPDDTRRSLNGGRLEVDAAA